MKDNNQLSIYKKSSLPFTTIRPPKRSGVAGSKRLSLYLPNRKAASPSKFLVRNALAVANSSPTSPSRISHVCMANFGFSVCCGFGLAVRSPFAISKRARQSCM